MDFTPSRRAVSSHAHIRTLFSLLRFRVMGRAAGLGSLGPADQGGEWELVERIGLAAAAGTKR
jgi:hypothetical protein